MATLALGAGAGVARDHPATPRCFGAAARDPLRPCDNPRLRLTVTPSPDEAQLTPNLACRGDAVTDVVAQCAYGLAADQAAETVALVGDSHAAHWRAAMAVVARARQWRVLELATPHCPFSASAPDSGPQVAASCPDVNRRVLAWLGEHPELRTVFFSAHSRAPIVVPAGRTSFATRVDGYVREWQALPATVQRIVVIRDDPIDRVGTFECVRHAMAARRPAASSCAVPRRGALVRDAEVAAARRLPGRVTGVVDLSPVFCGRQVCLPVIGGVLVHKDVDHLGQLFAHTLGPQLLRGIDRVLATAPAGPV